MFKPSRTYDRVAAAESQAELDDWHEEPIESVESRSRQVNLHRRPGFYKKALFGSVAMNAVLLMACGWLYLKLKVSVPSFTHSLETRSSSLLLCFVSLEKCPDTSISAHAACAPESNPMI